jgi:hypothetical protein
MNTSVCFSIMFKRNRKMMNCFRKILCIEFDCFLLRINLDDIIKKRLRALYEKIVSQKVNIDLLLKSNPLLYFSKVIGNDVSKSSRTQLYIEDAGGMPQGHGPVLPIRRVAFPPPPNFRLSAIFFGNTFCEIFLVQFNRKFLNFFE